MVEEADKEVETISVEAASKLIGTDDAVFVDIRDIRELQREGKIPGATHAPRGMLEFWVDPDSPYYRDVFGQDKQYVFYCAGAWRSALAAQTVQKMGMTNVCHLGGGFSAWKAGEMPIELLNAKKDEEE
ncbi:MAG: rhodanese-like domain-containing protein [Pseudomonadales bacterium]